MTRVKLAFDCFPDRVHFLAGIIEKTPAISHDHRAYPHHMSTQGHGDYLAEVLLHLKFSAPKIRGACIIGAQATLHHATARFEPTQETLIDAP